MTLMKNSFVPPFRMNTYKSLDLKSFRINTYKKRGGGGVILLTKFRLSSSSRCVLTSLLPLPHRSNLHWFARQHIRKEASYGNSSLGTHH